LINPSVPRFAPGGPGIEPRWTRGAKVAVGTAYSTSSRVWYTLDYGCVTEVYYPTIDSPQIRDLQFLVTDGENFFHDERRNFVGDIHCISEAALGFEVTNREKEGRYSIHKTVLGDPHGNCLLVQTHLQAPPELLPKLSAMRTSPGDWRLAQQRRGASTGRAHRSRRLQRQYLDGDRSHSFRLQIVPAVMLG
jgi:hypothetical protein